MLPFSLTQIHLWNISLEYPILFACRDRLEWRESGFVNSPSPEEKITKLGNVV